MIYKTVSSFRQRGDADAYVRHTTNELRAQAILCRGTDLHGAP